MTLLEFSRMCAVNTDLSIHRFVGNKPTEHHFTTSDRICGDDDRDSINQYSDYDVVSFYISHIHPRTICVLIV